VSDDARGDAERAEMAVDELQERYAQLEAENERLELELESCREGIHLHPNAEIVAERDALRSLVERAVPMVHLMELKCRKKACRSTPGCPTCVAAHNWLARAKELTDD